MAEARLSGISKSFGATEAVYGLSLDIADGEFVVLLGPTGAGKTTILRLMAGLEAPDSGTVHIGGRDVTKLAPVARDVAFVFQQYALYPHYSVYDNLAFPLRAPARRMPEDEIRRRVGAVAELLRISPKLGNRATQLSGGEMQRVAIGRALVREPALFLMDEPLSSLDARLREDLRIELKRIQRERGATILYVTHDQTEAMTLADRVGVLDKGWLVQIGAPRTVYDRPASLYVAGMLGSPPVNILKPGCLGIAVPPGTATVGLRPEDILPGAPGGTARVMGIERLGADTVLLLDAGDLPLRALAAGHLPGLAEGADITIGVRPGAALFFDAEGLMKR